MLFTSVLLLGAATGVLAVPATQQLPTNASLAEPTNFEVTLVYVEPAGGCPATPTACAADDSFGSAPKASPGIWKETQPVISESAPSTTLLPGVHWDTDTTKISNIIPVASGDGCPLFYGSSDPTKPGYLGFITYVFGAPSVNLDHCSFVSIACTATGCTVTFSNKEAYDEAVKTWKNGLILVAYTAGCPAFATGERCFFSVTAIDFRDGLVIVVVGSFQDPKTLMIEAEANWGRWEPGRTSGTTPSNPNPSSRPSSTTSASSNSSFTFGPDGVNSGAFGLRGDCVAPIDARYGLPTACLGPYFDEDLDEDLGVGGLPSDFDAFIRSLAPGLDLNGIEKRGGITPVDHLPIRHEKRILNFLLKIILAPFTFPISAAILLTTGEPLTNTVGGDLNFKLPDRSKPDSDANKLRGETKQATSPWGDAILIKSFGDPDSPDPNGPPKNGVSGFLNIFCVGCGTSGKVTLKGTISWLPIGVSSATIDLKADADLNLKLGIDAQIKFQTEGKTELLRAGLPGLTFGPVVIGPFVEAGARVTLTALARGRLLIGAEMGLKGEATLDLINSANSKRSGWDPQFKPVVEAEGEIILSAELGLPIGLKVGIAVAGFKLDGGIVDEPSVKGTAQVAASVGRLPNGVFAAGFKEVNGCTGISAQISWRNVLFLEAGGKILGSPLHDTGDKVLAQLCIPLPGVPTQPGGGGTNGGGEGGQGGEGGEGGVGGEGGAVDGGQSDNNVDPEKRSPRNPLLSRASNGTSKPKPKPNPYANLTFATNVKDLTSAVKANATELTYSPTPIPNIPYNDTFGGSYSLLTVPDGSIIFIACDTGAVYAVKPDVEVPYCSELWATYKDILVSDGASRVLHYYANTMAAVGVSRLMVSDEETIPKQAVGVVLSPDSADDSDGYFYIAVDPQYHVYYPVMCGYQDGTAPKLFLAADPVKGVEMLESADVEHTVTGGKVKKCFAVTLRFGQFEGSSYEKYVDHGSGDTYPFELNERA